MKMIKGGNPAEFEGGDGGNGGGGTGGGGDEMVSFGSCHSIKHGKRLNTRTNASGTRTFIELEGGGYEEIPAGGNSNYILCNA
jgi:hypothetical protein